MTYAQLDIHFDEDPQYVDLELDALGLLACAESYIARQLTDGFIPTRAVRGFGKSSRGLRVATTLVSKGVWREVEGGFEWIGYLASRPSRADVEAKRAGARSRKRIQRNREDAESVTRDAANSTSSDEHAPSHVTSRARAIHSTSQHSTTLHSKGESAPTTVPVERTASGELLPLDASTVTAAETPRGDALAAPEARLLRGRREIAADEPLTPARRAMVDKIVMSTGATLDADEQWGLFVAKSRENGKLVASIDDAWAYWLRRAPRFAQSDRMRSTTPSGSRTTDRQPRAEYRRAQ